MDYLNKIKREIDNFNSKYHHTMTPYPIGIIADYNPIGLQTEFKVYHDLDENLEIEIILKKTFDTNGLKPYDLDEIAKNLYCEVIHDLIVGNITVL